MTDPRRRCSPLTDWPARDRAAWAAAIQTGNVLDGQGPAAHWRPKTCRTVIAAYGRYLHFLDRTGVLDRNAGPESWLTPDRLRSYIAELSETVAPVTVKGRITNLAEALRVMHSTGEYPYLRMARRRLKARAYPTRNKRARMVPIRRILELGLELIALAEKGGRPREIWNAATYRDGVMILVLASRPIRCDNFIHMRLGKELKRLGSSFAIVLSGSQTKNHRAYECSLDPALTPFIDRYLEHYRKILLGTSNSDRVWIAWGGRGISGGSFSHKLRTITLKAFGKAIPPHFVRDCAMTSLATENPEHVWLSMSLLHHADPRIAEKHYNLASDSRAVEKFQISIQGLRRKVALRKISANRAR